MNGTKPFFFFGKNLINYWAGGCGERKHNHVKLIFFAAGFLAEGRAAFFLTVFFFKVFFFTVFFPAAADDLVFALPFAAGFRLAERCFSIISMSSDFNILVLTGIFFCLASSRRPAFGIFLRSTGFILITSPYCRSVGRTTDSGRNRQQRRFSALFRSVIYISDIVMSNAAFRQ